MLRRPNNFWQDLILEALGRLGGAADLQDITNWIRRNVDLTDHELGDSGHEGRDRYVHTVRSCAWAMVNNGKLERLGRGRYQIRPG